MVGIYKIESPTGNVYIGQSVDILTRFKRYKRMTCQRQIRLHRSLVKYSPQKHEFSVLHELPTDASLEILNNYEVLYIEWYKNAGIELLNIKSGGGGGGKHSEETKIKIGLKNKGRKMPEHQRLMIIERMKGHVSWNKGKKGRKLNLSPEQRRKRSEISKRRTGFKHTEEMKRKFSIDRKGRPCWNKGKTWSEEHKKKLSVAHAGKKLSAETKAKLVIINTGRPATANKLSEDQVREIKKLLSIGELSQYRIAKNFGVHKVTIFDIKHGKCWKNVS